MNEGKFNVLKKICSLSEYMMASLINAIISAFSTAILTRLFSPDIFGVISLFNSASTLLMGVMCLGLDSSYIRFFYAPPNNESVQAFGKKCFCAACLNVLLWGGIISLFFATSFSNAVIGINSRSITIFLFVNVLGQIVLRFLNISYRMKGQAHKYFVQSVTTQIFLKFFVVLAVFITNDKEFILCINAIGIVILAFVYLYIQYGDTFRSNIKISFVGYSEVIKFAIFSCPITVITYLNTYFSQIIIKKTLGEGYLGIYSAISLFTLSIAVFRSGFATFWSPFMYKHYSDKHEFIKTIHDLVLVICMFILSGILLGVDVIYLFIGNEYRTDQSILGFLMLGQIFITLTETTSYGIMIEKKSQIVLVNHVISLCSFLLFAISFVKLLGILGIALASAISGFVLFALSTYWGQKYYISIHSTMRTAFSITCLILIAFLFYVFYNCRWIFVLCNIILLISVLYINRNLFSYFKLFYKER